MLRAFNRTNQKLEKNSRHIRTIPVFHRFKANLRSYEKEERKRGHGFKFTTNKKTNN